MDILGGGLEMETDSKSSLTAEQQWINQLILRYIITNSPTSPVYRDVMLTNLLMYQFSTSVWKLTSPFIPWSLGHSLLGPWAIIWMAAV